jgi:ABC-type amino acid transport substrate-binding protein
MEQLYRKRIDFVIEEYLPFMYYSKEKKYTDEFAEVMLYLEDRVCTAFSKTVFGDKTAQLAEKANDVIKQLKAEGFIDRVILKYRD